MVIKWKNNLKLKYIVALCVLLVITAVNVLFYPLICSRAQETLTQLKSDDGQTSAESAINLDFLETLYRACYVLYLEYENQSSESQISAAELFIGEYGTMEDYTEAEIRQRTDSAMTEILDSWSREFEEYRSMIDYCMFGEEGAYSKNTNQSLENAVDGSKEEKNKLGEYYSDYFQLSFDAVGKLEIEPLYSQSDYYKDALIKSFQQVERMELLLSACSDYLGDGLPELKEPENFRVIFAVPRGEDGLLYQTSQQDNANFYYQALYEYAEAGATPLYVLSLIVIAGIAFVMRSRKLWGDAASAKFEKKRLMEAALIGVFFVLCLHDVFVELAYTHSIESFAMVRQELFSGNTFDMLTRLLEICGVIFGIYVLWYVSVSLLCPVFSLGIRGYIRQYSFIYQIFPWLKEKWGVFMEEMRHIDFGAKSTKTIIKAVIINFVVLSVCSLFWFFGIGALAVYSVVLFLIIKRYYDKTGNDYRALLHAMHKIADGNLDAEIRGDFGMFEPLKEELKEIQKGLRKAVDEEVKSQRMKTELITNVSHDLKTPLTAITTYIELLKKEDITEEERRSYIETLERKSLRLKVLIEDLFEVSKATSKDIVLNPIELDVVNLIKQVSIEYADKLQAKGLDLRFRAPEEKTVLLLDNQKTYRIFENLFVNVSKYAMPDSRVYIEVKKLETEVEIVMKNMSAEELSVSGEEITERFVRGDSARNTEGSGLGLAIAKSFTEAQGGKFHVEVDGDLFKVVILFKCGKLEA